MSTPFLTSSLVETRKPLFIVDEQGIFAESLVEQIASDFLPIILTRKSFPKDLEKKCIIIPFSRSAPKIPDNNFNAILYVSNHETASSSLIRPLLKEARKRTVSFVFIQSFYFSSEKTLEDIALYDKAVLFLYGEPVGGIHFNGPVAELLANIRQKGSVVLHDQGMDRVAPVSFAFLRETVVRYALIESPPKKIVVILPQGTLYEISVVRLLQHMVPLLHIDFTKRKKKTSSSWSLPSQAYIAREPRGSLEKTLSSELSKKEAPSVILPRKVSYSPFYRLILGAVLAGGASVLVIIFFILGMAFFGGTFLKKAVTYGVALDIDNARQYTQYAKYAFIASATTLDMMPFSKFDSVSRFKKKVVIGKGAADILEGVMPGLEVYKNLLEGKLVAREELVKGTQGIKNGLVALRELQAGGGVPKSYEKEADSLQKLTTLYLATADIIPSVLGYDGERKYLLLFQNNNELRPGGGFIGSYGIVKIQKGKVVSFVIHDVYDADGQLTGHVEPPFGLRRYLGLEHWYLRDSNFSPDFLENAGNAAFFLNLETGEKVDGVLALDTALAKGVLATIGQVIIPGYNKTVTASDFDVITQEQVEGEFFPGSTEKREFLTAFYQTLLAKVFAEKGKKSLELLKTLNTAFEQKHLLLALANESLQSPITLTGVSSKLTPSQQKEEEITDFVGINEANIGTNKVNRYIQRALAYDVVLSETGDIQTTATLSLTNRSDEKSSFGGDYKAYVRFILPEGISPQQILVDGVKQVVLTPLADEGAYRARGSVSENTLEVDRVDEKGKTLYGFLVQVPQGIKKTITFSYRAGGIGNGSTGTYALEVFKQPGTGPDPYSFSFQVPASYSLITSTPHLEKREGKHLLLSHLLSDQKIVVMFGKK